MSQEQGVQTTSDTNKIVKTESFTLSKYKDRKKGGSNQDLVKHYCYPTLVKLHNAIGSIYEMTMEDISKTTYENLKVKDTETKQINSICRVTAKDVLGDGKRKDFLVYDMTCFARGNNNAPLVPYNFIGGMDRTASIEVRTDLEGNELQPKLGIVQNCYTILWSKETVDSLISETEQEKEELQYIFNKYGGFNYEELTTLEGSELTERGSRGVAGQFDTKTLISKLPAVERLALNQKK